MACRAYTGPVVCVELSVIKGCYSAGRTEVKFVPLTQGIFQEVCLSDRVVRNVPADSESSLLTGMRGSLCFQLQSLFVGLFISNHCDSKGKCYISPVNVNFTDKVFLLFYVKHCSLHDFK